MKQAISALSRLAFTLAIVALVVVINRSAPADPVSPEAVRCELDPPRDIAGLEACLARSPRDLELVLDLAAAYDAAGRATEARAQYARAVEIDPHDEDARKRLDQRR